MTITVLLADDEGLIRTALATLLPLEGDLEILAEASDGSEAIQRFDELQPDVALLDLEMPEKDGLDVAKHILTSSPGHAVVILTRHARPGVLRTALRLGVRGFLGKDADPSLIAKVAAEVAAGGRYVDAAISAQALIEDCPLTERERDVLRVAGEGYSVSAIAQILHLAPGTIRNYLSSAIGKTHTTNRHDAARHAREHDWL